MQLNAGFAAMLNETCIPLDQVYRLQKIGYTVIQSDAAGRAKRMVKQTSGAARFIESPDKGTAIIRTVTAASVEKVSALISDIND
jgi:hypothetical protein